MSGTDSLQRMRASDGVGLAYRRWLPERPHGFPLILLHGAASNSTRWWHFVQGTRLRSGHVLLRPDLRGHGESIWRGPAGMAQWCDDLDALLRHEGHARAIVVGHCLGANLALNFAARHPQRCAGLVLVEPMAQEALTGTLARLQPWLPLLRLAIAALRGANRIGLYRRRLDRVDLEQLDRSVQQAADRASGDRAMQQRYASPWHDLRILPSAQYLNNLVEVLRPLPLAGVACPVQALLSRGRLMADPQRTRQALAVLPAVECVELDAKHWIPTEQPEAMRDCIDDWVERREATPGRPVVDP